MSHPLIFFLIVKVTKFYLLLANGKFCLTLCIMDITFQKSLHYSYYQLSCDQKNSLGNLKTFIPCASSCAHLSGIVLVCNK